MFRQKLYERQNMQYTNKRSQKAFGEMLNVCTKAKKGIQEMGY